MRNWPLARKILREQEEHISPWRRVYLNFLGATFGKLVATFLLILLGAALSDETGNWMWFSRSGCLVAVLGIFIVIKNVEQAVTGKSRAHKSGADIGQEAEQEAKEIVSFCSVGDLTILVLGNLIWGFGDLVGNIKIIFD